MYQSVDVVLLVKVTVYDLEGVLRGQSIAGAAVERSNKRLQKLLLGLGTSQLRVQAWSIPSSNIV